MIREMRGDERYVDYNRKPLGNTRKPIRSSGSSGRDNVKSQSLSSAELRKSIEGRDWLVALSYKNTQPTERGECKRNTQPVKSYVFCEMKKHQMLGSDNLIDMTAEKLDQKERVFVSRYDLRVLTYRVA